MNFEVFNFDDDFPATKVHRDQISAVFILHYYDYTLCVVIFWNIDIPSISVGIRYHWKDYFVRGFDRQLGWCLGLSQSDFPFTVKVEINLREPLALFSQSGHHRSHRIILSQLIRLFLDDGHKPISCNINIRQEGANNCIQFSVQMELAETFPRNIARPLVSVSCWYCSNTLFATTK